MTGSSIDLRRLAAELTGTFFLVLIGPGAAMVNAWTGGGLGVTGIALAFAFVVIGMVYALGHVSGAHINPAVTIAFWSARRFPAREVIPYVVAQCAGAVAASAILRGVLGPVGHMGATLPGIAVWAACVVEWLLSFVLMLVIMAVATDDRVAPGFAAIAVGLTVGFCALTGGPLTGASMNPARSFGPALVGGLWQAHWIYWLAPITAMIAAARLYDWLRGARPPARAVVALCIGCGAFAVGARPAFGQSSGEAEHVAVLEIGGAAEWGLTAGPSSVGGTIAAEVTPIEEWLELEAGVTAFGTNGRREVASDLIFKKPFRISRSVEFMAGLGPELSWQLRGAERKPSLSTELALDFMFWTGRHIGWYVEPSYSLAGFRASSERSLGVTGGVLIGIP